jgi:hypothetical protein
MHKGCCIWVPDVLLATLRQGGDGDKTAACVSVVGGPTGTQKRCLRQERRTQSPVDELVYSHATVLVSESYCCLNITSTHAVTNELIRHLTHRCAHSSCQALIYAHIYLHIQYYCCIEVRLWPMVKRRLQAHNCCCLPRIKLTHAAVHHF